MLNPSQTYSLQTEIFEALPYEGAFHFPCLPVQSGIRLLSRKPYAEISVSPSSFSGEFSFLYLREGSCLVHCDDHAYILEPRKVFLTCNAYSYSSLSDNSVILFFTMQGEMALFLGQQLQKLFGSSFTLSPESPIINHLEHYFEMRRSKRTITPYEESEFCYHFLLSISMEQNFLQKERVNEHGIPKNLVQTVTYMESHLDVPFLSMDKLAAIANLSKFHFSRLFSKYYGISPGKYLLGKRLYHAAELLESKKKVPLKDIAKQCGFSSETYFCNVFRKAFHRSPGSHRRLLISTRMDIQ